MNQPDLIEKFEGQILMINNRALWQKVFVRTSGKEAFEQTVCYRQSVLKSATGCWLI